MKKYAFLPCFLFCFLFLFNSPIIAKGAKLVQATQPGISLPMISAGENQVINQPVNGDLMVFGRSINISSNVTGDAYVGGGQVNITGNIGQDLIVAGGTVTISGNVTKNLIIAGGEVRIENQASIGGYVLAAGNLLNLNGRYAGPVKVAGNTLTVGNQTVIAGNLEADVSKAEIPATASILGERKINIHQASEPKIPSEVGSGLTVLALGSFLSKLLLLLIMLRLFRHLIQPATDLLKSFLPNLGWGLVVLISTPFLIIALLATLIGIPLALIVLVLYLMALYLSQLIVAGTLGRWITEKGWLKIDSIYLQAIVGLILLSVVSLIPVLGGLVRFVVLLLGLGLLFRLIRTAVNKA